VANNVQLLGGGQDRQQSTDSQTGGNGPGAPKWSNEDSSGEADIW
jgi:hypothetical protein